MGRYLFIGHEASLSGAPLVLLRLMQWIKRGGGCELSCLLLQGGGMEGAFREVADTRVLRRQYPRSGLGRYLGYASNCLRRRGVLRAVREVRPDVVYMNTVATCELAGYVQGFGVPVVVHVHELESVIRLQQDADWQRLKAVASLWIAASEAVRENLIERHGLAAESVVVVHEFIVTDEKPTLSADQAKARLCAELGLPTGSVIVGGAGVVEARKGTDLFVEVAEKVREANGRDVHFVWMGATDRTAMFEQQIKARLVGGASAYVHFLDERVDPMDWIAGFDVFAMTSREDPYPLVVLESALMGKPTVCFDSGGGAREFVEADAGIVVQGHDTDAMAARIVELANSQTLRERLGELACEKVKRRHSVEAGASAIMASLQSLLRG